MYCPSGENVLLSTRYWSTAGSFTSIECDNVRILDCFMMSQTVASPLPLPSRAYFPSGENATLQIFLYVASLEYPVKVYWIAPVSVFHKRAVSTFQPARRYLPSG